MPNRRRRNMFEGDGRRTARTTTQKLVCSKCDETGHLATNCNRWTIIEKMYEKDRLNPGINFEKYKDIPVTVTTPGIGTPCPECKDHTKLNKRTCTCTKPIKTFSDLRLDDKLQEKISNEKRCNYKVPTPIQRYALPIITEGFDVMGCAQTGTGKTGAYIIPMVKFIKEKGFKKISVEPKVAQNPEILIIAPTRELAVQIYDSTVKLAEHDEPEFSIKLVYGGKNAQSQREKIRRGCNILIGTPGRVQTFINDGTLSMENIKFFVLDEADRMIDMGFRSDIINIEGKSGMPSRKDRQTLLFSATFRKDLQDIAASFLKEDYKLIEAGEIGSAQPDVAQFFELVDNASQKTHKVKEILVDLLEPGVKSFLKHKCWEKRENVRSQSHPNLEDFFLHVLGSCADKKILIFVETKVSASEFTSFICDYLYSHFKGCYNKTVNQTKSGEADNSYSFSEFDDDNVLENFGAVPIHGFLDQYQREEHLEAFRAGVYPIMVATNVAARGLDIQGVTHVINYDLPKNLDTMPRIREEDEKAGLTGKKKPVRDQFEEYIHRIGRTGRAGNTGNAVTLLQKDRDLHLAIPLVRMLSVAQQEVPEWLFKIAEEQANMGNKKGGGNSGGSGGGGDPPSAPPGTAEWNEKDGPVSSELWGNEL